MMIKKNITSDVLVSKILLVFTSEILSKTEFFSDADIGCYLR